MFIHTVIEADSVGVSAVDQLEILFLWVNELVKIGLFQYFNIIIVSEEAQIQGGLSYPFNVILFTIIVDYLQT
ncbi:MAG: hypothetical protein EZS28_033749, partial [Streblomastix strix]